MSPDYLAARVAETQSAVLLGIGAATLNVWWCALGFGLFVASGWLVHKSTRLTEV